MWRFPSQVVALNFLIKSGCRRSQCGSFAFIFQSWTYIIPAHNLRLQKLVSLSPSNSNERMSKKGKVTGAKKWGKDSSVPGEEETASVISLSKDGRICVKILAKPGTKQSNITDISSDGLGVQIGAPAREGEANEELIRFLAEVLNVRKRSLSLDKGSKSRQKIVSIESTEINIEQVRERLSQNVLKE